MAKTPPITQQDIDNIVAATNSAPGSFSLKHAKANPILDKGTEARFTRAEEHKATQDYAYNNVPPR